MALLILAFATVTLGKAIASGQAHALDARERVLATSLAKRELDVVLRDAYEDYFSLPPQGPQGLQFAGEFNYQLIVGPEIPHDFPLVNVSAPGKQVTIVVRNSTGRELARLAAFVYQP